MKQYTSAEYKYIVNDRLAALDPLHQGHPNQIKFIKSVTDFMFVPSYHSLAKTML